MTAAKKIKTFFYLLMLLLVVLTGSVSAESAGLSVDTSLVMLRMQPGKETKFAFTLKNQTDLAQVVHLEAKDIEVGDENEINFLDFANGPSGLVVFKQNNFVLEPGQVFPVEAKIDVPVGQETRIQMMALVSFFPKEKDSSIGPKVEGNIGVYMILTGDEAQNATGNIEKINYPKSISDSISVSATYVNKGDLQFVPQGKVLVLNAFSGEGSELPFENHFVFPERKVTFTQNLSGLSPFGLYKIKVSFKDGNKQLIEKTKYVFGKFFPWVSLAGVLFFSLFVIIIIRVRRRNKESI